MMSKTTFVLCAAMLLMGLLLAGCGGDASAPQPESTPSPTDIVAPMDDYNQQAAKDINEQNAEAELKKLQAEISADPD